MDLLCRMTLDHALFSIMLVWSVRDLLGVVIVRLAIR